MTVDDLRAKIRFRDYAVPGHYSEYSASEYRKILQERRKTFREHLEIVFSTVGHPKADKLWDMSWDHGHSTGLEAVLDRYSEIVELIR